MIDLTCLNYLTKLVHLSLINHKCRPLAFSLSLKKKCFSQVFCKISHNTIDLTLTCVQFMFVEQLTYYTQILFVQIHDFVT